MSDETDYQAPADRIDVDELIKEASRTLALGAFDAAAVGRELKMDALSIRFALGLLQGKDKTEALRSAGHTATGGSLRSKASKKAKIGKVQKFLARAKAFKVAAPDGPLDDAEKLRILAQLSRSSNPAIQTRAVLAHQQLQGEMAHRDAQRPIPEPEQILREIASAGPMAATIANILAEAYGLEFRSGAAWSPAELAEIAAGHQPTRPPVIAKQLMGGITQAAVTTDARPTGAAEGMNGHARE